MCAANEKAIRTKLKLKAKHIYTKTLKMHVLVGKEIPNFK